MSKIQDGVCYEGGDMEPHEKKQIDPQKDKSGQNRKFFAWKIQLEFFWNWGQSIQKVIFLNPSL